MTTAIIIPARLHATRLPRKPLALIAGVPMIVHVWKRAMEAKAGAVFVATDAEEIASAVESAGGQAIMTRDDHESGSDRIFEALGKIGPEGRFDAIVNLQGDLPTLEPRLISDCIAVLSTGADIGTLAVKIDEPSDALDPNIVKVVSSPQPGGHMKALYFTRASAPFGPGPLYHHIGIYAYRPDALARFVALPPSSLEKRERLEQLRALEAGMTIAVAIAETLPLGVDTPAELATARRILGTARPATSYNADGTA